MHTVEWGASPFLEQHRYLDMEEEEEGKVLEGWGRVRWLQTGLPPRSQAWAVVCHLTPNPSLNHHCPTALCAGPCG